MNRYPVRGQVESADADAYSHSPLASVLLGQIRMTRRITDVGGVGCVGLCQPGQLSLSGVSCLLMFVCLIACLCSLCSTSGTHRHGNGGSGSSDAADMARMIDGGCTYPGDCGGLMGRWVRLATNIAIDRERNRCNRQSTEFNLGTPRRTGT